MTSLPQRILSIGVCVLILASLGIIVALPQLVSPSIIPQYAGAPAMEHDSEMHYLARLHAAIQTRNVGNPFLADAYSDIVPTQFTGEYFLALPVRALSGSLITWFVFYKFFLGFLLALSLYSLLFTLTRTTSTSLLGSAAVIIGTSFIITGPQLFSSFHTLSFPLHFSRFSNPLFPAISFFVTLAGIWKVYSRPEKETGTSLRNVSIQIITGLLCGMLLYWYVFYWIFCVVLIILLFFHSVSLRRTILLWDWIRLGSVVLCIAIPYAATTFALTRSETGAAALERHGTLASHEPYIGMIFGILCLLSIGALLFVRIHKKQNSHTQYPEFSSNHASFISAITLSAGIVLNQQIITGHIFQPGHFHWYVTTPLCIICLIVCWNAIAPFTQKTKTIISGIGIGILLSLGAHIQIQSVKSRIPVLAERQNILPALHFLEKHEPHQKVVLANNELANIIPVFTRHRPFYANGAVIYPIAEHRIRLGHFAWWKLSGLTPDALAEEIRSHPEFIQSLYESHSFRWRQKNEPGFLVSEAAVIRTEYEKFLAKPILPILTAYNVKYILINPHTDSLETLFAADTHWEEDIALLFSDTSLQVYELLK